MSTQTLPDLTLFEDADLVDDPFVEESESEKARTLMEERVLYLLAQRPMTDHELQAAYINAYGLGVANQESPRKRRSDLSSPEKNQVYFTGERRVVYPHRASNVWAVRS